MMETLKKFFANPWTKRGFSLLSLPYGAMVCWFAYLSVIYRIEIVSAGGFGVRLIAMCVLSFIVMFYTRKTLITTIVSTVPLLCLLPIVLFNLGDWLLIIPICVVSVVMFFLCGAGEGGKTILGTSILLVYMLGTLAYFVYTDVLASSIRTSVAEQGTSVTGMYDHTVTYAEDKSQGCTYIDITTNEFDLDYGWMYCDAKGFEERYAVYRPMKECTLKWETAKRTEITEELLKANPEVTFAMNERQMEILGLLDGYTKTFDVDELTSDQLEALGYVLTAKYGIPEGCTLYTEEEITLSVERMHAGGIAVTKDVALADLSDKELEKLGVPEEGDVLYADGKVIFRYYTAILTNEMAESSRTLVIE